MFTSVNQVLRLFYFLFLFYPIQTQVWKRLELKWQWCRLFKLRIRVHASQRLATDIWSILFSFVYVSSSFMCGLISKIKKLSPPRCSKIFTKSTKSNNNTGVCFLNAIIIIEKSWINNWEFQLNYLELICEQLIILDNLRSVWFKFQ